MSDSVTLTTYEDCYSDDYNVTYNCCLETQLENDEIESYDDSLSDEYENNVINRNNSNSYENNNNFNIGLLWY